MKSKKKKLIDFIQNGEELSKLSLNEIKGGREVASYMDCGAHHDDTELTSRLLSVV